MNESLKKLKELTDIIKEKERTEGFSAPGMTDLLNQRLETIALVQELIAFKFFTYFDNVIWKIGKHYELTALSIPAEFIEDCANLGSMEQVKANSVNHAFFIDTACVRITFAKQYRNVSIVFENFDLMAAFIKNYCLKCDTSELHIILSNLINVQASISKIIGICK